jgi:transposase
VLIEAGMSQRDAAKLLGVSHTTTQNDVANNLPETGNEVATQEKRKAKEQAREAETRHCEAALELTGFGILTGQSREG